MREDKKKYFGEKPVIPWMLEEERNIKDWGFQGNTLVIVPAKANFERLLCTSRYSVTSLYYWRVCCVLEIVKDSQMGKESEDFFRQLKRLECELFWKGILSRKPVFQTYKALNLLISEIPNLQPDKTLSRRLEGDDLLVKYLKSSKPDSMVFFLESTYQTLYEDEDLFMADVLRFYNKPKRIVWNIALYRGIMHHPGVRGIITNLYDALDRSAGIVKEVTESVRLEKSADLESKGEQ